MSAAAPILVVDDDPVVRYAAVETLIAAGMPADAAESGEEALRVFATLRPSLVLLDVNMDGMDGYEVCRLLRKRPDASHVPIIMLTGLNDADSIDLAYVIGATDFITKPINWTLLTHRVRYALRTAADLRELEQSRARLARAQRTARLAAWRWDVEADVLERDGGLDEVLGLDVSVLAPAASALLPYVADEDRAKLSAALENAAKGVAYRLNYRLRNNSGVLATLFEQGEPVLDMDGRVVCVEGITQNISEQAQTQARVRYLSFHDSLTGLANRQFFRESVPQALARARRTGTHCALVYLDVDRLKRLNDTLGHAAGDQALNEIAARIADAVRESDLLARADSGGRLVARVAGDEFTLLLTDIVMPEDAEAVTKRLLEQIARPVYVAGQELWLSASAGIAMYPDHGEDADTLLKNADLAMYQAKQQGGNRMAFFSEPLTDRAYGRLAVENAMRKALARDQFLLFFQPKIDGATGKVLGAEALLRWQHPERGLVPPMEFIPVAEECGLIVPIGEWVVQRACEHLRSWLDAGFAAVPLAVNLSAEHLRHPTLPDMLRRELAHWKIPSELLCLEITESQLVEDMELTRQTLCELKDMGLKLSLDDFGTGYSSLAYLKRFPIDELKIDRQFVQDVDSPAGDGSLTQAIIAIGQVLDKGLVAEGVETQQQAEFLLRHGCRSMQGFLFAKPMPAAEFVHLLVRRGEAVTEVERI
ncbi:MAG: EAL domain-containing protein [Rhodocyclaceae bacterium]|nr:EAL domain-containing protein [Rhodocyclaceae bacterium]MBX3667493.1 EAL domain-containing protein [Rhodocyclaceae bacterium]